jgi:hypothetical protein
MGHMARHTLLSATNIPYLVLIHKAKQPMLMNGHTPRPRVRPSFSWISGNDGQLSK